MSSIQPTITISSMSELTGVADSVTAHPHEKEQYVVVNPENIVASNSVQRSSSGNDLKLSLHGGEHSVSPSPPSPPPSLPPVPFDPLSSNYNSFTVVSDRDIMKAIPVSGLSSAADTALEIEMEMHGKDVRTNDETRVVFDKERTVHFDSVMIQLIKSSGISLGWLQVIKPLVMEATRKVKTNVYSTDTMDIKEYVRVKKIPGGRRGDSTLVNGVVCTKNITHKKMKISIRNPTVLLLKCAFEFQRKENQLSSFDTLQMQEEKYLKNLVARVKTFQPRVILVQKSVARLALEMFFHLDIVVAVNVKPSVMERVARSTQGDLLHSLDQLFFNVQLGKCGQFHLRTFVLPDATKKTLMYFDQCNPRLGCTITLMGGSRRELKKVKKATLFGVFVAYNSQLETSFLIDEFAWPAAGTSSDLRLLPDVEGYSSSPTTPEWPLYPATSYPVEGIEPAELARKLEALIPERRTTRTVEEQEPERCTVELEPDKSSSKSTPTMPRASLGSRSSNASPLLSNTRSYSLSGYRHETLTELPGEADRITRPAPTVSRSVDDVRLRNDPPVLPIIPRTPDPSTLSQLGKREFEKVLSWQILSITPGVRFPVPYLQTPLGFTADIRRYLPSVIYWSHQFLVALQSGSTHQRERRRSSPSHATTNTTGSSTSTLEMGITAWTAGTVADSDQSKPVVAPVSDEIGNNDTPSYRSISEHPFTTAIFLLKANTNEMRAALADYRANSGLANPSREFFFPTASRASDYRQHLQNVFNKYSQQFELAGSDRGVGELGEGGEGGEGVGRRGLDGGSLEGSGGEGERHIRRRARRRNTPSLCASGKREGSMLSGDVVLTKSHEGLGGGDEGEGGGERGGGGGGGGEGHRVCDSGSSRQTGKWVQ